MRLIFCVFFLSFSFLTTNMSAQLDWRSWSSVQFNYKASDRFTFKLKPIVRHNSDLGNYDNTSIDVMVAFKINQKWSGMVLNRYWFLPDQEDREFWFFDLSHKTFSKEKFSFSNQVRYHLAVDWNRKDIDFFRYAPNFSYKINKTFQTFFVPEMWFRLNDKRVLGGFRHILGTHITFSKKVKLTLQYWRQVKQNKEFPIGEQNVIVTNLSFNLN